MRWVNRPQRCPLLGAQTISLFSRRWDDTYHLVRVFLSLLSVLSITLAFIEIFDTTLLAIVSCLGSLSSMATYSVVEKEREMTHGCMLIPEGGLQETLFLRGRMVNVGSTAQ